MNGAVRISEGENYVIDLSGGIFELSVVRRPDRDSSSGADQAEMMCQHVEAGARRPDVRAALFDLSQAPQAAGPRTQAALGRMFAAFGRASKPAAIVVGSATQRLQMERLAREHGGGHAEVHDDVIAARAWLVAGRPRSS